MTARPIRRNAQTPDRNGKIFYTSTTSLSHISKELGEEVPPIPLWTSFANVRTKTSPARRRIQPMPEDGGKKAGLCLSVIMNIVMLVAIIAMFVITLNSDQPNILNYERNLQNKYASWEQELTRREQTVREKERELHIENTGNTGNTETEVSQN